MKDEPLLRKRKRGQRRGEYSLREMRGGRSSIVCAFGGIPGGIKVKRAGKKHDHKRGVEGMDVKPGK